MHPAFMLIPVGLVFAVIGLTIVAIVAYNRRLRQREIHIAEAPLPAGLIERVKPKHPHLNAAQWRQVEQGLRQFFRLNLKARSQMVAMPSQVVDDLWHEFILYTRNYQDFCKRSLGRFLHHTPAVAMESAGTQRHALRRAWLLACADEKINPKRPSHLPKLFALDASLAIVGGFVYQADCQAALAAGQSGVHCGSDLGSCSGGCSSGGGDGDGGSDSGGDGGGCGGGCGGGGGD